MLHFKFILSVFLMLFSVAVSAVVVTDCIQKGGEQTECTSFDNGALQLSKEQILFLNLAVLEGQKVEQREDGLLSISENGQVVERYIPVVEYDGNISTKEKDLVFSWKPVILIKIDVEQSEAKFLGFAESKVRNRNQLFALLGRKRISVTTSYRPSRLYPGRSSAGRMHWRTW